MSPVISVCIPAYNQEKYIEQCLTSIIDQDIQIPYEIIVADDCSSDGTKDIVMKLQRQHPNTIKLLTNSINLGPTQNALLARSHALGKYICNCDGDDFFYKEKLRVQYEFLEANPGYIVAWHQVDFYGENGSLRKAGIVDSKGVTSVNIQDMLAFGSWGANSSIMYRYDGVPFKTEKYTMYDFEFSLLLLSKGSGALMPNVLGGYRVGASGSLTDSLIKKRINHLREAQLKLWLEYVEQEQEYRKFVGFFSLITLIKSIFKKEKTSSLHFKGIKHLCCLRSGPSLIGVIKKRLLFLI